MLLRPEIIEPAAALFTGVEILRTLIQNVIHPNAAASQHTERKATATDPLVAHGAESTATAA